MVSPPMSDRGHGFGPTPVFLAGISTILGAIMFLRFGYAVGHLGLMGAVLMIAVGHMVTIPTALAISEIATNRRVEGGGEYFIISRSFGLRIGTSIGAALYLSQAISVAFYCIALGEAATPLSGWFAEQTGMAFDVRFVSLPAMVALALVMIAKGADIGVKVLYLVVATLTVSLVLFFAGAPVEPADGSISWSHRIADADAFFVVFAICFPGFTGMTAGVGLSGDLARPRRAIPIGTLGATAAGLVIYLAIVFKLGTHASPELLATDQMVMSRIALWGPIIPIGLAAAALSSAIGSILVAPRTLQALAKDACLPLGPINRVLGRGHGASNEPRVATMVTSLLALVFVAAGDVDFVARLISMFFMVTYGSLCAISFLQHFASNPSYRPGFRTRWYISLFGAGICLLMMFQMDPLSAIVSTAALFGIYALTRYSRGGRESDGLAVMFHGVMTQLTRFLHVRLQRGAPKQTGRHWRPSIVCVQGELPVEDDATLRFLSWLCVRYGFGTYILRMEGYLDETSWTDRKTSRKKLVSLTEREFPGVYAETMVSPSVRSALAQALQMPGVSGLENNTVLFSCPKSTSPEAYQTSLENAVFASVTRKNLLFLRHDDADFGKRENIHVWLTWHDSANANLMLLVAYMLLGHPDWRNAEICVFAAFPSDQVAEESREFSELLAEGRIPIGEANIRFLPVNDGSTFRSTVERSSRTADLVLMGTTVARLKAKGPELLGRHPGLPNTLFVAAHDHVRID